MADELVLYTNPMSRGRIARWMMEETGQPYRTEILEYGTSMKAPAYLAVNPMGKVPAIKHGDIVVTEAAAICAYLADAFPEKKLAPPSGSKLRGPYYRWLFFGAGCIEPAAYQKSLGLVVPDDKRAMVGYGHLDDVTSALEGALTKGPFLLGEQFSAADIYVAAQVGWGMQFGTLEKRPVFVSYFDRLQARPALKRAAEIDDTLMAEMKKAQAG